jgi:hypothetical protein
MKHYCLFFFACLTMCISSSGADKYKPRKFGDVTANDFDKKIYSLDSSAAAIYLFDIGSSEFDGNNKGFFSVVYKKHARIRLLKKTSFEDLATIIIPLYQSYDFKQEIADLQAATYNLENGKVVVTRLDKTSLFLEKETKNIVSKKFTFPNITEGSIIEFTYKVTSPSFTHINEWYFQGRYPKLWSQYDVTIPSIFDFVFLKQGYQPYRIDTAKVSFGNYTVLQPGSTSYERTGTFTWSGNTINSTWAMEEIPAIRNEGYTTTLANHVAKIEFQFASLKMPDQPVKHYMRGWTDAAADLMKSESFGLNLTESNGWLNDDCKKLVAGVSSNKERAKKIFEYVRDNFECTDHSDRHLSLPLKKIYQNKKGNVTDINLLLTAMLLHEGLDARPVLLSTRDNGRAIVDYPLLDKYNYVICRVLIDSVAYVMDASDKRIGFNKLPSSCYNGYGREIGPLPLLVNLSADSVMEQKTTSFFLINSDNGITGAFSSQLGYEESHQLRARLAGSSKESFFTNLKKGYSYDIEMSDMLLENLDNADESVTVKYEMKFKMDEDIIYFNPLFGEAYKENPFKSAKRIYPVEMPSAQDEVIVLNMEVPKGYEIEELPKSAKVKLNDTEGLFEYMIGASDNYIQLRCRIRINKANFTSEDYQTLREFYTFIVNKQQEQIVFKKKKS